jgi:hypothetical protein
MSEQEPTVSEQRTLGRGGPPDPVPQRATPRGRDPEAQIAPPAPEEFSDILALVEVVPVVTGAVETVRLRPDRPSDEEVWERAKGSPKVKRALGNKRFERMGLSIPEPKEGDPANRAVYVVYRYDDQTALDIEVDLTSVEVVDVREVDYEPALTASEERRAIAEARRNPVIAALPKINDLEPRVLGSQSQPEEERRQMEPRGPRQAQVAFFANEERLPRAVAVVDLATDRVVKAHRMDEIIVDLDGDTEEGTDSREER